MLQLKNLHAATKTSCSPIIKIYIFFKWDIAGGPVVKNLWVQSLVREVRSHMLQGN